MFIALYEWRQPSADCQVSVDSRFVPFFLQRGNGRTPLEQVAWGMVMSLPSTSQGVLDKQLAVYSGTYCYVAIQQKLYSFTRMPQQEAEVE
jgi:hypothetical protein